MKSKNFKNVVYLFLALMISVAVSGGCGGGGGHYSGDFGNSGGSGQEVTPESVSPDVMPPEPEEPVLADQFSTNDSDSDEYGAGGDANRQILQLLNKTVWKIESIDIKPTSGQANCKIIPNSFNNIIIRTLNRIAFMISDNLMTWDTPTGKDTLHGNILTVQFRDNRSADLSSADLIAPVFRPAQVSKGRDNFSYEARITYDDWEYIEASEIGAVIPQAVAKSLVVTNIFTASNNVSYRCTVYLSIDLLASLHKSEWQIANIQLIQALNKDEDEQAGKPKQDPKNFPVNPKSLNLNSSKITFSVNSNNRSLSWIDGNNKFRGNLKNLSDSLSVRFTDNLLKLEDLTAYILKPASSITNTGTEGKYHVFQSGSLDEFFYISDYGLHATVMIVNYCKISDQFYWATLVLKPYNPNNPNTFSQQISDDDDDE